MATNRELPSASEIAHVLRRTGFGLLPSRVAETISSGQTIADLVDERLGVVLPFEPRLVGQSVQTPVNIDSVDESDLRYYRHAKRWWIDRMRSGDSGVHEKLMWHWHGVFTTSESKVDSSNLCWRQLRTLHTHAAGNFGDLLRAMTVDGAMLRFLDGDRSIAEAPNENYAREMMELFTLGFGEFDQADVEAGARALAGWEISSDLSVSSSPGTSLGQTVRFLGHDVRDVDGVVAAVLNHDACAPHVVTRLWETFIGGPVDTAAVVRWAAEFRSSGYEIAPLIASMLHSAEFHNSYRSRARSPIEWYCAVDLAAGPQQDPIGALSTVAQVPFDPPNVSGWPPAPAWFTTTQTRARAHVASSLNVSAIAEIGNHEDALDQVLARCSLDDLSAETSSALSTLDAGLRARSSTGADRVRALLAAAVLSPEFSLA